MNKIGTGTTVPSTVFPKIVIFLVITIATRSMAENSAIVTGMEATVRSSVPLTMTRMDITRVTEQMALRCVWKIGLGLSAKRIVKQ